jgi:hypothetical protein
MGKFPIKGCQPRAPIDHKEQEVSAGDCRLRCGMGRGGEVGIGRITDPSSIDDLKGNGARFANTRQTVTGDAGLIMNDRHAPSHETIEQGGFTDVGPAHNCNTPHGFWELGCEETGTV